MAVKKITIIRDDSKRIEKEIDFLKNLNHPNIIAFHGYSTSKCHFYLVFEFMEFTLGDIIDAQIHPPNEALVVSLDKKHHQADHRGAALPEVQGNPAQGYKARKYPDKPKVGG